MRVARIQPERLVDQRRHCRQEAFGREVEIVSKPAIGHEKTDERLGHSDVGTVLEDDRRVDVARNRAGLAIRTERPLDRSTGLIESSGRSRLSALGIESVWFAVMITVWARNALLLTTLPQATKSGGVQPFLKMVA